MRTLRTLALAALAFAALPMAVRAQSAPAKPDTARIDVTGKWNVNIESPVQGTPTIPFTQRGDSIRAKYTSNAIGPHDSAGTIKARTLPFSSPAESGGQSFVMAFTGKLDDPDTMTGTIDFPGLATGPF